MAKCAICEKAAHLGKVNGASQKMYVCTSCLRSGKVERA